MGRKEVVMVLILGEPGAGLYRVDTIRRKLENIQ